MSTEQTNIPNKKVESADQINPESQTDPQLTEREVAATEPSQLVNIPLISDLHLFSQIDEIVAETQKLSHRNTV